ncbi:MAG: hypothetical protein WAW37_14010 [Syntrophobacteraceae bacterium]
MKINSRRMKILTSAALIFLLVSGIAARGAEAALTVSWPKVTSISTNEIKTITPEMITSKWAPLVPNNVSSATGIAWGAAQVNGTLPAFLSALAVDSAAGAGVVAAGKWVALQVPVARLATIAKVGMEIGIPLAATALAGYAARNGWSINPSTGAVEKPGAGGHQLAAGAPSTGLDGTVPGANQPNQVSYFASGAAAYAAAVAYRGDTVGVWGGNIPGLYEYYAVGIPEGYGAVKYFVYSTVHPEYINAPANVPPTSSDHEAAFNGGLGEGHKDTWDAMNSVIKGLSNGFNNANKGWPYHTGDYTPMTPTQGATVQNAFDQSVTNNQNTEITNHIITINNGGLPAPTQPPAPATTGLTKSEVTAAINDSAGGAGEIEPLSSEANPAVPDETPIPTYLENFWSAIRALPVVSLLTNIQLTASGGSPIVQVSVPYCFTAGSYQISMNFNEDSLLGVNYGYFLGLVGNVLLAFCGIRWTMYLFSSGE